MQHPTTDKASAASDLDWLLQQLEIVKSAWKLVIPSFLALSLIVTGALYALTPKVYSSSMILRLTPRQQTLFEIGLRLAPLKTNNTADPGDNPRNRHTLPPKTEVSEIKRGSGLFSISISDSSAQRAQATLQEVLAEFATASKPSGMSLASATRQLESYNRTLTELQELSAVLKQKALAKDGSESDLYARSLAAVATDILRIEEKIWEIENLLQGFKTEDVLVSPSLPSSPDDQGLKRKVLTILLLSALLPILFVLVRAHWQMRRRQMTGG